MSAVASYLREIDRRLEGQPGRARVLAELSDHLLEAVDAELARGHGQADAERRAVRRCGDPSNVARPFLRRPPRYVGPATRWFIYFVTAVASLKVVLVVFGGADALLAVTGGLGKALVPSHLGAELDHRIAWASALSAALGTAQIARWWFLKRRGTLIEVSSSTGYPDWHRKARPWLVLAFPGTLAVNYVGFWLLGPTQWAISALFVLAFALVAFAVARRHFWRQAVLG